MEWHSQTAGKSSNRDADMAINDALNNLDKLFEITQEQVKRGHEYLGEQFIRDARQIDTYKDQTANLRNSIGYKLIAPGEEIAKFGGGEGGGEGKQVADSLSLEVHDHGIIMVAGMNYAVWVEAKGYDVISNSVESVRGLAGRIKDRISDNVSRKLSQIIK